MARQALLHIPHQHDHTYRNVLESPTTRPATNTNTRKYDKVRTMTPTKTNMKHSAHRNDLIS